MENNNRLLSGVKVVELSTFVAAPICAKALAEWGADVIKVESLGGDPLRFRGIDSKMPIGDDENPNFDLENSYKRTVGLNLKSPKGREIFDKLIADADVFVTNIRTAALVKMGLSYEQLSEKYPGIIFAQILGYGEEGPDKDKPGYDFTGYFARGGILGTLYEKNTSPLVPVQGFGDHQCGMYLAGGICAALYNKLRTGKGEKVTVGLYQAAIYAMGIMITSANYGNSYPVSRKEVRQPLLNTYLTKDNRCLMVAVAEYDKYFTKFVETIGIPEIGNDENYCKLANLGSKNVELIEMISKQIEQKNIDEWLEIFANADLPCEKAYLWEEILEDEQAWANGYLRKVKYPSGNERALPAMPVTFKNAGRPEHKIAPSIGENTDEILLSLGYSEDEIKEMKENKDIQ
ncbi:MAG: CoA transferase [Clostridiales bacterium]|nr:CoA transferase [Clostridiales bacterium]